ncbi:hypothetical protein KKA47_02650, partial [bacterium]|nr:hypothetical protein [bacterium]
MKKTLHIFFLLGILAILANGCHSRFDDYIDDATTAIEPAYDFVSISKYTCNAIPGTIQFFNYYTEAQLPSPKGLPQILVPQGAWNGSTTAAFAFKDVDTNITTTIWNEGSRLYVGNKNYSVVLKATVRSIKALKVDPNLLGIIVGTDAGLHWVVATQDVSGYWIDPIIQNSIWTAPVTSISLDSALTEVISGDKTDIIYFTADGNVYTALLQELRNGHGCVFQAYNKLEHKDKYSRPHRAFKVVSSNGIAAFITESHSRSDFTTQDLIDGNINISDLSSAIWIIDNRSDAKRKAAFIKFGDYTLVPFDITYEGDNLYATAIKYKSNLNIEPKVDDTLNVEIENFGLEDAPEPVSGVLVYPTPHYTPLISSFIEIPKDLNGTYIFHKVYT